MQHYINYFSKVLRLHRVNAHLTQSELAEKVGLSKTSIANYEQGLRRPDQKTIKKIAKALNIDSSLFKETEIEEESPSERRQSLELILNNYFKELNIEGLKELSRIASWLTLVPYFKNN